MTEKVSHDIKKQLRKSDSSRRTSLFFLLLGSGAISWIVSAILIRIGLSEMWIRYALSFCVLYVSLIFSVWKWLNSESKHLLETQEVEVEIKEKKETRNTEDGSFISSLFSAVSGEGFLVISIVIFVLVVALCLIVAPILILDLTVVEILVLAVGLRTKNFEAEMGFSVVLLKTLPLGILFLIISAIFGLVLSLMFPHSNSLVQVILSIWK